jgi:hypothetical protein
VRWCGTMSDSSHVALASAMWLPRPSYGWPGRFPYVLAGSSYSVPACEERVTDDLKQTNESWHIAPYERFRVSAAVLTPDLHGYLR